jgi:hypothetical protein
MTKSKLSEKEHRTEIPIIKKAETPKSTNNSRVFEKKQQANPVQTKIEGQRKET